MAETLTTAISLWLICTAFWAAKTVAVDCGSLFLDNGDQGPPARLVSALSRFRRMGHVQQASRTTPVLLVLLQLLCTASEVTKTASSWEPVRPISSVRLLRSYSKVAPATCDGVSSLPVSALCLLINEKEAALAFSLSYRTETSEQVVGVTWLEMVQTANLELMVITVGTLCIHNRGRVRHIERGTGVSSGNITATSEVRSVM